VEQMKRALIALIFSVLTVPLCGAIYELESVNDIDPYVDGRTLVLFDLDLTVLEASTCYGSVWQYYDGIRRAEQKGATAWEGICGFYADWRQAQRIAPMRTPEPETADVIRGLQAKAIGVAGLTHRQPCIGEISVDQLLNLGIDFESSSPFAKGGELDMHPAPRHIEGTIFVNDCHNKGVVLKGFLSTVRFPLKRVVFIDDKRDNLEAVEAALAPQGIEVVGLHYRRLESVEKDWSWSVSEMQRRISRSILSDHAARTLRKIRV
jgi:hypothetical protein